MGIEVEGPGQLYTIQQVSELGANEGGAGVRGVHVHPDLVATDGAQLGQRVERAARSGTQRGQHLAARSPGQ